MADTYLQIRFQGEVEPSIISRCEIRKAFGLHSLVIVDILIGPTRGPGQITPMWPEWTTVQLDFGKRYGTVSPWYGYVHHHQVMSDVTSIKGPVVRYVLIGTSGPMNDQRTRAWHNVTATSLARTIFKEHGLRTVTSVHPRVLPYWAQPGTSDWQVLTALTEISGYRLYVDGPVGTFVDPRTLLTSPQERSVPTYVQARGRAAGATNTLLNFEVVSGHLVPRESGTSKKAVQFGVDKTGRLIHTTSTTQTDLQRRGVATKAVEDFAVGQSLTDAQVLTSRGWITSRARINGDAALVPGGLIAVVGNALLIEDQGRWLVCGVTHLFDIYAERTKEMFTTTLDLERDQLYAATFNKVAPLAKSADTTHATTRGDGTWVAQMLGDTVVR